MIQTLGTITDPGDRVWLKDSECQVYYVHTENFPADRIDVYRTGGEYMIGTKKTMSDGSLLKLLLSIIGCIAALFLSASRSESKIN